MPRQTVDISGFGGEYEATCQRMLWKGIAYLAEIKPLVSIWEDEFTSIVGIFEAGPRLKELERAVTADEPDVTGAMHYAVMKHLCMIHHEGVNGWIQKISETRPDRIIPLDPRWLLSGPPEGKQLTAEQVFELGYQQGKKLRSKES